MEKVVCVVVAAAALILAGCSSSNGERTVGTDARDVAGPDGISVNTEVSPDQAEATHGDVRLLDGQVADAADADATDADRPQVDAAPVDVRLPDSHVVDAASVEASSPGAEVAPGDARLSDGQVADAPGSLDVPVEMPLPAPDAGTIDGLASEGGALDAVELDSRGVDGGVVLGSTRLCDSSGWCWVHPLPTGNDLLAVLARGPADVWLGGWYGALLHWDGTAWMDFNLTEGRITGIAAEPSGAVWVVGDAGMAARFDGTGFTITDTGTQSDLAGVAAVGADQVYAVGAGGTVIFWDGARWAPVTGLRLPIPESSDTRPETRDLLSVWGSGSSDVWIGGAGVLWRWQDGTWAVVTVGSRSFTAITGTSASEVWFAGSDGAVLRWNGGSLSTVHGSSVFGAGGIWVGDPNDVWVSYYHSIEHWDGNAWTPLSLSYSINGLSGAAAGDVWGVGTGGAIAHWNGRTWSPAPPPAPGLTAPSQLPYGVRALWVSGANDVWLASMSFLYHFDGSAMTSITPRPGVHNINVLWGSGPRDVWAFGAGGEIIHWDGVHWSLAENTGTDEFLDGGGSSANDIWAVGLHSAYHFDGVSWASKNQGVESTALQAVYTAGPGLAWAGGFNDTLMCWNGQNWSRETAIPSSSYTSGIKLIWGTGPSNVWAFGENAYHYDGQTWDAVADAKIAQRGWGSGPNDFWGVSGGNVIHYDGTTWTNLSVNASLVQAIAGFGPGDAWLGCAGGILRRTGTP